MDRWPSEEQENEIDRQIRLETWLEQLKEGLISREQRWFRCSAYEIREFHGNYYIVPQEGATLEYYCPFDCASEILTDFYELLVQLKPLIWNYHFGFEDARSRDSARRRAELLLPFISKYGPFGIFFEQILYFPNHPKITNVYVKPTTLYEKFIDVLLDRSPDAFRITQLTKDSDIEEIFAGIVEQNAYFNLFFPWNESGYPTFSIDPLEDERDNEFRLKYGENESLIIHNQAFMILFSSFEDTLNLTTGSTELVTTERVGDLDIHHIARDSDSVLLPGNYSFSLVKEDGNLKIAWQASSLIEILILMHGMNIAGQLAENVRICKLAECNNIVMGNRKYCCNAHADRDRKRRQRQREKE